MEEKKKALVIGGTGGIGSAIVKLLLLKDFEVCATYVRKIPPTLPGVTYIKCDVTDERDRTTTVDTLTQEGGIDVVFHVATPPLALETFDKTTLATYKDNLSFVEGTIALTQLLLPLLKSGSTCMYFLSEAMIREHSTRMSSYLVGKYALLGFLRSIEQELRGRGVRVLGVLPSYVETSLLAAFPEKLLELERGKTGGSFLTPDAVAEVAVMMVDEVERFKTGDMIIIQDSEDLGTLHNGQSPHLLKVTLSTERT